MAAVNSQQQHPRQVVSQCHPQIQQPVVHIPFYPQYLQQQVVQIPTVPSNFRRPLYYMSISLLTLGILCLIFGGICLGAMPYGPSTISGSNIWSGFFYLICGALGITQNQNPSNPSTINAFYAFSIITFIFSLPHLALSIASFIYGAIISASISLPLSLIGLSLSLALLIILSHNVYCSQNRALIQNPYTTLAMAQPEAVTYQRAVPLQQQSINPNSQLLSEIPMAYPSGRIIPTPTTAHPQSMNIATRSLTEAPPDYNNTIDSNHFN
ncbi:hypothetical protein TrispH2_004389 [Trichoplax sp. H2]|nr:hypothetical protein TrispH2_004389 [Trichoplax sp. H2]|eukprot:RDD44532.1 hypothetical protein TrispH2_004389 [Trichoplax sp. H2]